MSEQDLRPSVVRQSILADHNNLRRLSDEATVLAQAVLGGDSEQTLPLRRKVEALLQALLVHLELENAILLPALQETDAYGPLRAEELKEEHDAQREAFQRWLRAVEGATQPPAELAQAVLDFHTRLQADMENEERDFLSPKLLRDDPTTADTFTG
ncbi:MAG: hemerythrin domain-containing protein [Polyangiales bacterium]